MRVRFCDNALVLFLAIALFCFAESQDMSGFPRILRGPWIEEASLVDRIVQLDEEICNNDCYKSYPTHYRPGREKKCQLCYCDEKCHFYRDCCPGVILKLNVTYEEVPRVTGCVVNRAVVYRDGLEYDNYQAMITRCPSSEGGTPTFSTEDRDRCEQPDLHDPQQSMPVSSPHSGFTY
ncbi:hypothetical protein EGW08_020660, partial [Elysia chlorotica]